MKNLIYILTALVTLSLVASCDGSSPTEAPPPTNAIQRTETPSATLKPTNTPVTPTETPTPTDAPPATSTPVPQIFQPIFPERFTGAGVASHHYCTQDDISCLHFDVGLPIRFIPEIDPVLAPASGNIIEHYVPGEPEWGECITIQPVIPLLGIDELVKSYGYDPNLVRYVYYHLCHIIPQKIAGYVEVGEVVGTPKDLISSITEWEQWANIVAFVVRIGVQDSEIQVSPCVLPNEFDWCGICYPGAVERNPCP